MDVLLILYGELRTFETAIKTYNIFNHANVDVIVDTQTTSKSLNDVFEKNVTKDDILSILPNAKIYLEDRNEYQKLNTSYHKSPTKHSFFKINNIINSLEKEYDIIFVNRLDSSMFINNIEYFLKNFNKNKIYLHQEIIRDKDDKTKWFVPDHFFVGTHFSIKYFFNHFSEDIDSHSGIANYLDSLPFESGVWEDDMYSIHIRPNMVNFINSIATLSEMEIYQKMFNWLYVNKEHTKLESKWKQ
jgi:hypothetical protein